MCVCMPDHACHCLAGVSVGGWVAQARGVYKGPLFRTQEEAAAVVSVHLGTHTRCLRKHTGKASGAFLQV